LFSLQRNITEYYNAVDTHNMISIFASMLNERRIVFKSQKLSRLSACVQAANILLYPMVWQHLFIPLLPKKFIANLGAPFPFIFGVPASTWEVSRTWRYLPNFLHCKAFKILHYLHIHAYNNQYIVRYRHAYLPIYLH